MAGSAVLVWCSVFILGVLHFVAGKSVPKAIELTENNWTDILQGEWMVKL